MTKLKNVQGLTWKMSDAGPVGVPRLITVQVTSDEHGKTLSLTDEWEGVQIVVPLEPLADMFKVAEE